METLDSSCACTGCRAGGGCCGDSARSSSPYRAMTHGDFIDRLRRRVRVALPEATFSLHPDDEVDDLTRGILDAWAAMTSVVAFYQERLVQEGYLTTATEDRSVRELARLVGHEPRQPSAAETTLVMTVEDSPGASPQVRVARGTQVQNAPDDGQEPQVFETLRDYTLRPEWNALRPYLNAPDLAFGTGTMADQVVRQGRPTERLSDLYVERPETPLGPGDIVLFFRRSGASPARNVSAAMRISEAKPVEGGYLRLTFDETNLYEQRDTP